MRTWSSAQVNVYASGGRLEEADLRVCGVLYVRQPCGGRRGDGYGHRRDAGTDGRMSHSEELARVWRVNSAERN